MEWYLGELVMEITVSGAKKNAVHKNLTLIKAAGPEMAYKKAINFGRKSETSYKNPQGQKVKIRFRGISQLEEMYDTFDDGAELRFDEYLGVKPSEIRKWISPKSRLQVFLKPKPFREQEPDYRAQYVVDMALATPRKKKTNGRAVKKCAPLLAAGPAARPGERPSTPARAGVLGTQYLIADYQIPLGLPKFRGHVPN